jgi:hypothetical protein
VESGGHPKAFGTDPFQVNKPGDWPPDNKKALICGLTPDQEMTPARSAAAALEWWRYKAYNHDSQGRETSYKGDERAFRNYNGNRDVYPYHPGVQHRDWYAKEILQREGGMLNKGTK